MFTIRDPNTKNYLRCLLLGGWFSNRGKGLKSSHFVCSDKVAMGVDPGENPPMDRVGSAPQKPGASNSPEHISFIQFQLWSTKTYLCYLCKQFLSQKPSKHPKYSKVPQSCSHVFLVHRIQVAPKPMQGHAKNSGGQAASAVCTLYFGSDWCDLRQALAHRMPPMANHRAEPMSDRLQFIPN